MIKRRYVNKRGGLILGQGQKKLQRNKKAKV